MRWLPHSCCEFCKAGLTVIHHSVKYCTKFLTFQVCIAIRVKWDFSRCILMRIVSFISQLPSKKKYNFEEDWNDRFEHVRHVHYGRKFLAGCAFLRKEFTNPFGPQIRKLIHVEGATFFILQNRLEKYCKIFRMCVACGGINEYTRVQYTIMLIYVLNFSWIYRSESISEENLINIII